MVQAALAVIASCEMAAVITEEIILDWYIKGWRRGRFVYGLQFTDRMSRHLLHTAAPYACVIPKVTNYVVQISY